MSQAPESFGIDSYVSEVRATVERDLSANETARQVGLLNDRLFSAGFRMPQRYCSQDPDAPYTRNLIHQDEHSRFSIIAIVWGRGVLKRIRQEPGDWLGRRRAVTAVVLGWVVVLFPFAQIAARIAARSVS